MWAPTGPNRWGQGACCQARMGPGHAGPVSGCFLSISHVFIEWALKVLIRGLDANDVARAV